jgi:integrase
MPKVLTQAGVEKIRPSAKQQDIADGGSRALFLRVQPSGHKSWIMRFRRRGADGADRITLGPLDISHRRYDREPQIDEPLSVAAARIVAARVNADRASGIDVVQRYRAEKHRRRVNIVEAAANSFGAAARDFVEQHAKPKTRGWKETASNLGLDADLNVKSGGLAHRWAARDIKTIDSHDLWAAIEEARQHAIPGIPARNDRPSEARQLRLHSSLSRLFTWLQRKRRVDLNPMATLRPPVVAVARDRVLTANEIATVWNNAAAAQEPYAAVMKLLLLTGCRLNEVAKLQWCEVSDDYATITWPGTRTKNSRPHILQLPPLARDIVAAQSRHGKYVFSRNGGLSPASGWSKAKERVDRAAAIADWRIHDLRRTFVSGLAELGVAVDVIEATVNHVGGTRGGVAGVYNRHHYTAEKRDALQRWAAHVERIVSGANVVALRAGRP